MPYDIKNRLKIAVTSRALFQLEHENEIYEKEGLEAYTLTIPIPQYALRLTKNIRLSMKMKYLNPARVFSL